MMTLFSSATMTSRECRNSSRSCVIRSPTVDMRKSDLTKKWKRCDILNLDTARRPAFDTASVRTTAGPFHGDDEWSGHAHCSAARMLDSSAPAPRDPRSSPSPHQLAVLAPEQKTPYSS